MREWHVAMVEPLLQSRSPCDLYLECMRKDLLEETLMYWERLQTFSRLFLVLLHHFSIILTLLQ